MSNILYIIHVNITLHKFPYIYTENLSKGACSYLNIRQ